MGFLKISLSFVFLPMFYPENTRARSVNFSGGNKLVSQSPENIYALMSIVWPRFAVTTMATRLKKRTMLHFLISVLKTAARATCGRHIRQHNTTFTPSGGVSGMRLHGSLNFVNKQHGYCVYCGNRVT